MRAILSAPGSRGDVNPMVAIGASLKRRGYDVIISLAEPYVDIAREAGLTAVPVISTQRFDEMLSHPSVWKPIRGPRAIFREVVGAFLPRHLDVIRDHHRPGETVLVSHPLDLASRIYRDFDPSTPLFDVHLAPSILRTLDSPPRLTPWWFECSRPQWLQRAGYWLIDVIAIDPLIAGKVNQLRAEFHLSPIRRVIDQWWLSPDRILAMYPEWFAPSTTSFRPRLVHCGFPLDDGHAEPAEPPTNRPIVFTAGTAHRHSRDFFARAAIACHAIGQPGLLVSTHAANFPDRLPPTVQTAPYVSFSTLLPKSAAIVHHGGIGTTSQALAAGIPQMIRPMAFDQFDNAARVERLNGGTWLRSDRQLGDRLAAMLRDDTILGSCRQIAERVEKNASERAAEEIQNWSSCDGDSNDAPR